MGLIRRCSPLCLYKTARIEGVSGSQQPRHLIPPLGSVYCWFNCSGLCRKTPTYTKTFSSAQTDYLTCIGGSI